MRKETQCSSCGKKYIFDDENIIYSIPEQFWDGKKPSRSQIKVLVFSEDGRYKRYNFCKECAEKYFTICSNLSEDEKREKLAESIKLEKDQSEPNKTVSSNPIEQAYQLLVDARDNNDPALQYEDRIDDAIGYLGELLDDDYDAFKLAFILGNYNYAISTDNDGVNHCYRYENGDWRDIRLFNEIEYEIFITLVNHGFKELAESMITGKRK